MPPKPSAKGRPSKRDVIVIDISDDDSATGQPAAKNVKRSVPSSEVVELRQKVLKLEDELQRANRTVRTTELRAEEAESKLESKHGIKEDFHSEKRRADGLEKRLTEVSSQRDGAIMRAENADTVNAALARENQSLIAAQTEAETAHQERLTELSSQLDGARRRADNVFIMKTELAREKEELKTEISELRRSSGTGQGAASTARLQLRIVELEKKLARDDLVAEERRKASIDRLQEERRMASEDRARYRERIKELEKKRDDDDKVEEERRKTAKDRLEEEKRRASEDRAMHRQRILELEQKLASKDDRLGEELLLANENRARIDELTQKVHQLQLASESDCAKMGEMALKLTQYEMVLNPEQLLLQLLMIPPPLPTQSLHGQVAAAAEASTVAAASQQAGVDAPESQSDSAADSTLQAAAAASPKVMKKLKEIKKEEIDD